MTTKPYPHPLAEGIVRQLQEKLARVREAEKHASMSADLWKERAERAEAENALLRKHAEAMAAELKWIAERYDDSKTTQECAADAYEMKSSAAQALHDYRAAFPKEPT